MRRLPYCPKCHYDDTVHTQWTSGRKLQFKCEECGWKSKPFTPDQRPIESTKTISPNQFHGWCYTLYDRYGHVAAFSKSYNERRDAIDSINDWLEKGKKKGHSAGPYTAILWPKRITVQGEVFK